LGLVLADPPWSAAIDTITRLRHCWEGRTGADPESAPLRHQCRFNEGIPHPRPRPGRGRGSCPASPTVSQLRHPYPAHGHDRLSRNTSRAEPRSVVYGAWNYSRVRWSSYPAVSSRLSPGRRLTHRPSRRTVFADRGIRLPGAPPADTSGRGAHVTTRHRRQKAKSGLGLLPLSRDSGRLDELPQRTRKGLRSMQDSGDSGATRSQLGGPQQQCL